jgi:hypothetical protein
MLSPSTSAPGPEPREAVSLAGWRWPRQVLLLLGVLSMAFGLYTGLIRLGAEPPGVLGSVADFHGAFMISGFLGTVISLERAVAFGRVWPYAGPLLSSIGAMALVANAPRLGAFAFACAGGIMLLASASIAIRQLALFTVTLSAGAACWIAGTLQWLMGAFTPAVTGWWLNFLVLTVAAERLELSRVRHLSRASQAAFAGVTLLLLLGSARGEFAESWAPLTAAGLLGCSAWLLGYDVARRTVRLAGQPRFSAIAILIGHGWLGAAGILLVTAPLGATAFAYDASVHAITIGFTLSMILGHAPIILPAVTGIRVRYSSVVYAPLILLHLSLAMRIAGDILERSELRIVSGFVTILALAAYAITLALASAGKNVARITRDI